MLIGVENTAKAPDEYSRKIRMLRMKILHGACGVIEFTLLVLQVRLGERKARGEHICRQLILFEDGVVVAGHIPLGYGCHSLVIVELRINPGEDIPVVGGSKGQLEVLQLPLDFKSHGGDGE